MHAVAEIIDAEDGFLFARVVGFGGDGHLLVVVYLDRGKRGGRLHGRRGVVAGYGRQRQPKQDRQDSPEASHRARLYHLRVDPGRQNPFRMILFFYNVALLLVLVGGAPWWLWRMATTQKYREGLLENGWD